MIVNNERKQAKRTKYTIREIGANLHGSSAEVTADSDVSSEPFPFSEDHYDFYEQQEFSTTDRNEP
jgi:hypothetical protein